MKCVNHGDKQATLQCTRCQRTWCGVCRKQLTVGEKVLDVCARCNAPLGPVVQRFRPSPSLRDLLSRPFTIEGLITAIAIGWLAAAFGWMPGIGNFVTLACYAALIAYYFQIITHIGEGKPGLPGPTDALHTQGEIWKQTIRGWMCVFAAALPFLIWNNILHHGEGMALGTPLVGYALMALGLVYLPAAIVCVAMMDSTYGALYPVAWIQVIRRAPLSYVRLWGLFMLSLITLALLFTVGEIAVGWVPLVGHLAVRTAVNLALFAQASLVGGFLLRHAEDFGYG
jgi:hypothetical protein